MKKLDTLTVMDGLRKKGWLVVLKVMPKELGYVVEGSRSEYDAPCPDRQVGKGQWCCEAQDMSWVMGKSSSYRNPVFSFGGTAQEAIRNLLINMQRDEDFNRKWKQHFSAPDDSQAKNKPPQ